MRRPPGAAAATAFACKLAPQANCPYPAAVIAAAAMQLAATQCRGAQPAQLAGRPASRAAQAAGISIRRVAAGAARQPQQGSTSLPPPPPAAAASLRSRRRAARCQAAADSDIIDVEGKVIDDRVPVTVRAGGAGWPGLPVAGAVARRQQEATTACGE